MRNLLHLLFYMSIVVISGDAAAVPNGIIAPPRDTRVERLWCPATAGSGETPVTCVPSSQCPPGQQLYSGGAETNDPPDRRIATCSGGDHVCCLPPPSKPRRLRQAQDSISEDNFTLIRAVLNELNAIDLLRPWREPAISAPRPPAWIITVTWKHADSPSSGYQHYDRPTEYHYPRPFMNGDRGGVQMGQAPGQAPAALFGSDREKPTFLMPPLSNSLDTSFPPGQTPGALLGSDREMPTFLMPPVSNSLDTSFPTVQAHGTVLGSDRDKPTFMMPPLSNSLDTSAPLPAFPNGQMPVMSSQQTPTMQSTSGLMGSDRVNSPAAESPSVTNFLETPSFSSAPSGRVPGVISKHMCKKYSELTGHDVNLSPLLPDQSSIPLRINDCSNYDTLVVGGTNASRGEFPHMAALGYQSDSPKQRVWICGGSLVSDQWILTAAHCLVTRLGAPRWVRLGWLGGSDLPEVESSVDSTYRHPGFTSRSKYNDLGLIRTSRPIPLSLTIRPACLPPATLVGIRSGPPTGTVTVATGWGKTSYGGEASTALLKVPLRVVDSGRCQRAYEAETFGDLLNRGITRNLICAGDERGRDTCQGDSGGPLQTLAPEAKCVFQIIGVTAYGKSCGIGVPGLYTNIAEYLSWIEDFVWPAEKRRF